MTVSVSTNKNIDQEFIIEPTPMTTGVLISHAVGKGRQCPITLINDGNRFVKIKKGTPIGYLAEIKTVEEVQASSLALRHTSEHRIGCVYDEEHLHLWCQLVNGIFHQIWRICFRMCWAAGCMTGSEAVLTSRKMLMPFPFGSGPEEVTFQQLSTHGVQNVACQQ